MAEPPAPRPIGIDRNTQEPGLYPYNQPKEQSTGGLAGRLAGRLAQNGNSQWIATTSRKQQYALQSAWTVLHHRDFRLYFAGSVLSNIGTWLQNTAQVLLVYQLTHSVFAVGIVTCAQFSSFLLLSHMATVLASRIGSKRLLIITQLFSAAIAGALAVVEAAGRLTERPLILGALLLGLSFTFTLPVQMALIPKLVDDTETEAAMAMNSVSYNAGRAIAPALAVVVILATGFTWVFALNAISFVVFAITLAVAHPAGPSRPVRRARARDGLSIALVQPRIALLLMMVAAVTFADDPILTLGPTLAHHVLGVSHEWAGYFLSALGLGTILGAFRPTASQETVPNSKRTSPPKRAAWPLLLLVGAIVIFAVGISVWMSLLAAFTAGLAALWIGAVTQTCLVRHEPTDASIMALWAIAWAGTKPLASLADGWLAGHLGVLPAAILLTTPALLAAALALGLRGTSEQAVKDWFMTTGSRLQKLLCLSVTGTD